MKVRIQDKDIAMLVNTGANVTLLSEKFVNTLPVSRKPTLRPVNTNLITATGESAPFCGQSKVALSVGSDTYYHNVLIANISNGGILGLDFLEKHVCTVNLSEITLFIKSKGEVIPCHILASAAIATCCKVAVLGDIEIPPRCEGIVPGATVGGIVPGQYVVIEPAPKFVQRKGLLVVRPIIDVNKEIIH